jgi:hypothetical protein
MRQNALCKTLHLCGRREVRGTRLRMHAVQVTRRLPHCQTDQGPQLYPSLCSIPLYLSLPIVLSLWMPLSVLHVCASVCLSVHISSGLSVSRPVCALSCLSLPLYFRYSFPSLLYLQSPKQGGGTRMFFSAPEEQDAPLMAAVENFPNQIAPLLPL